jgi:chromosome segregation ATPase
MSTFDTYLYSAQEREKELQSQMDTLRESEVALRMQVQQLKEEEGVLTKKGRVKNKRIKDLMEEVEQKDKELATQAIEAKTTATRTGKVSSTRTRLHFLSTFLRYIPCSTDRFCPFCRRVRWTRSFWQRKRRLRKC